MRYLVFIIILTNTMIQAQQISTQKSLPDSILSEFCFEYREPYFTKNFDTQFRAENKTHTIEEEWGLWGHNIDKFITTNDSMYARINGKINRNQFCFSSPALEMSLENTIRKKVKQSPHLQKFMLMPNDNAIVCQCDRCKSLGNTSKNASPTVFRLLNILSSKFPHLQFFSTAYISTQTPPPFRLNENVGVMISTMVFPKGILLNKSPQRNLIVKTLTSWRTITDKIYVWDYVINFDNYFDLYPTVLITQKNLQFYEKQGVTGMFLHGNEDGYTSFGDLKCYLYAQLLQDPYLDPSPLIQQFLDINYPSVSRLLYTFYQKIEQASLASKSPLDIYGGMNQAYSKYLNKTEYEQFYKSLQENVKNASKEEKERIAPLLLALTFQYLEILRTTTPIDTDSLKGVCKEKIAFLKELQKVCNINIYNETASKLDNYYIFWEHEVFEKKKPNLFQNKAFRLLSIPDEDYPEYKMLNDGLYGFDDYFNNWFLATRDNIKFQLEAAVVKGTKTIEISFLNDPKHRIYLPDYVIVSVDHKATKINIPPTDHFKSKINANIKVKSRSHVITIEVIKQGRYKNNSIACDEIIFN